jgi:hydrogenase maturation protein HypF
VGFRPAAFRLAREWGLDGWVRNTMEGAEGVLSGDPARLNGFFDELKKRLPEVADIQSIVMEKAVGPPPAGFEIRASEKAPGVRTAGILPDLATCPDCLHDIQDPSNRRHRYPFTNCTHCGPRYSILEQLPYDRPNTTMRVFGMCRACKSEYTDPANRRFHAQPNACPQCGPHLTWQTPAGKILAARDEALLAAAHAIREGRIVAVKGIGGFHLMVDARNEEAVQRLRRRKCRERKPFAVLFPSLETIAGECRVSKEEAGWLTSAAAPIVLLCRQDGCGHLSDALAPNLSRLGALLPYSPLHHLLMQELGFPVVATSGNRADEPLCIGNDEALSRLGAIADDFLMHNRPIVRPMDDSVLSVCGKRPIVIRRGRGLAPYSVALGGGRDGTVGAGAELKNTLAVYAGARAVMSPHIGDMDYDGTVRLWHRSLQDMVKIQGMEAAEMVVDSHPMYAVTREAVTMGLRVEKVQHHHAHVAACMAEHGLHGEVLGIAWDGAGWGPDGTIWGGEFLAATRRTFQRVAWLRPFPLVGGDAAMREPRRSAFGVAHVLGGGIPVAGFTKEEQARLQEALRAHLHVAITTSAGRLFDAVASFLGLSPVTAYEGEAAMQLEALADLVEESMPPYSFGWNGRMLDWAPMLLSICTGKESAAAASARFHATLVEMMVAVAKQENLEDICLTGGCFQNHRLLSGACGRLAEEGFRVWTHQNIPANDAGISLGQLAVCFGGADAYGGGGGKAPCRRC